MKKYANVVFLQGHEADEPLDILNKKGTEAVLQYLQQWDNGDYHEIETQSSAGKDDTKYEIDGYLICVNPHVGYIGLEKIINENSEKKIMSSTKINEAKKATEAGYDDKVSEKKKNTAKKQGDTKPVKSKAPEPGPGKKALATAKADKNENEVKTMKVKTVDVLNAKKDADSYKCEDLGTKLEIKGASLAEVNGLQIIATLRKYLEGRGELVKSIKIEMGSKKDFTNESLLRRAIRKIILEDKKK